MAGLLWQLDHLGMGAIAHVADKGDALLKVHLQRQQAVAALVRSHHSRMHSLQAGELFINSALHGR